MNGNKERGNILNRAKNWFREDPYFGILLVIPLLIWVAFTLVYPLFRAVQLSFFNVNMAGSGGRFVGVSNYLTVLTNLEFWSASLKSVVWTVFSVLLQVGGAIVVGLVLNQDYKGKAFIRNWIILPWVLPTIILAIMWTWILEPSYGVLNFLLKRLSLIGRSIPFLASRQWAMGTVLLVNAWRWTPYFAILVLAALQSVPKQLYEVAQIDGAGPWQSFWHVTLPTIQPILKVVTLASLLWSANIFDTIWLLTQGGPGSATTTLPIHIYQTAFKAFRFSKASTQATIMFLALLVIGVFYLRTLLNSE